MSTQALLRAARNLITNPERWTQRAFARSFNGKSIHAQSHDAICFCALGAIYRVGTRFGSIDIQEATFALMRVVNADSTQRLVVFNDKSAHAEVLAAFDRAIAEQSQ